MSPLGLVGILQLKVTLVLVEMEVKVSGAVGTIKSMKSTYTIISIIILTVLCCCKKTFCRWSLTYSINKC